MLEDNTTFYARGSLKLEARQALVIRKTTFRVAGEASVLVDSPECLFEECAFVADGLPHASERCPLVSVNSGRAAFNRCEFHCEEFRSTMSSHGSLRMVGCVIEAGFSDRRPIVSMRGHGDGCMLSCEGCRFIACVSDEKPVVWSSGGLTLANCMCEACNASRNMVEWIGVKSPASIARCIFRDCAAAGHLVACLGQSREIRRKSSAIGCQVENSIFSDRGEEFFGKNSWFLSSGNLGPSC